jgi:hypothetical protein
MRPRRIRRILPLLLTFCVAFLLMPLSGAGLPAGPALAHAEKGKKVKNAFKRFGQAVKKGAKATAGAFKGKGNGKSGGAKK